MELRTTDDEVIVYYTITLAAHVSLAAGQISRIVELREEIHETDDLSVRVTADGLLDCDPASIALARRIAEESIWPATWEFGY
jgi:hypothetical protein